MQRRTIEKVQSKRERAPDRSKKREMYVKERRTRMILRERESMDVERR